GISRDKLTAARKTLGWLALAHSERRAFFDTAQRLIYLKGTDSHDYKFSTAVLEDGGTLSPWLRDRFLAASVFWLKSSTAPDSPHLLATAPANPSRMNYSRVLPLITACLALAISSIRAQSTAGTGSVSGRVQNEATAQYLNNARITVKGTDITAFTDETGTY